MWDLHFSKTYTLVAWIISGLACLCPTRSFVGMTGGHWFCGLPFDTLMIKYGGMINGRNEWSVAFSWQGFCLNILSYLVVLVVFVVCRKFYIKRR